MTRLHICAVPHALWALLAMTGCPSQDAPPAPQHDASPDVVQAQEVQQQDTWGPDPSGPSVDAGPSGDARDGGGFEELIVGDGATSLSFNDRFAVWAELTHAEDPTCEINGACFGDGCKAVQLADGSFACQRLSEGTVWVFDRVEGTKRVVDGPSGAIQKDPVLDGTTVVWSELRTGNDFDLYKHDLLTRQSSALVTEPGDQDEPHLCGDRLVWIDRRQPPYGAAEREVWTLDLSGDGQARQLTDDGAEQTQPHCSEQRIVWTDYGADGDGVYEPVADPEANNGDIVGYDLTTDTPFVVTDHPSKQVRPAIYESRVVWLDWRGINPEPKYSAFKVFGGELGADLTVQVEVELATSSWQRPSLWQRPTVNADGLAGWVQENSDGRNAVMVAAISGRSQPVELIALTEGGIEGVQLVGEQLGFVTFDTLGFIDLTDLDQGSR